MKKIVGFVAMAGITFLLYATLRTGRSETPSIEQNHTLESAVDAIKEPSWWPELWRTPENRFPVARLQVQARITTADAAYLEEVVEQKEGQEPQRAAGVLTAMLRGRFPAIMPMREELARQMLAQVKEGYPNNEHARNALGILTYADRRAADEFVAGINFARPLPEEYRKVVAQQLAFINTDSSMRKLDEMLAAQGDSKLALFIMKPTQRYVPVEELARQWEEKEDTKTLDRLTVEWIDHIYEGYPLEAVTALMGQPQRSGPGYAQYVSKENHVLYLGVNAAGQIGEKDGPR